MITFLRKFLDVKFLKFVLVGALNTLVGSAIMYGLYNLFGVNYWISSAANYFFTSILSFFLNKNFTFQYKETNVKTVFRFALNICVCWLLAFAMAKPLVTLVLSAFFSGDSIALQENIAMLVGQGLFVLLNYFGQRFFAFRQK